MRYPPATWRPTGKHGYGNDDTLRKEGIVGHSMEGSLAAAFGKLDRPDRQASWHFSVAKSGDVYQHIDTDNISYASGSYEANKRFWSIEHEGVAGEPLTAAQQTATTALMGWLLGLVNLPPIRNLSLFEHREMTVYGAAPTACPSGRIPWQAIIAALQEKPERAEVEMILLKADDSPNYYVLGPTGKHLIKNVAELYVWERELGAPKIYHQAELDAVPDA